MTKPPGLPNIILLIFCAWKTDCGNSCGCRKHEQICNIACKICAGTNCTNIEKFSSEELIADELEAVAKEDSMNDTFYCF